MKASLSLVSHVGRILPRRMAGTGLMVHRDSDHNNPKVKFEFNEENKKKLDTIISNYPEGYKAAALIPALDLAQRQHGWLPISAMHEVARILDVPRMRAYEVATFYTMYPCWGDHEGWLVHVGGSGVLGSLRKRSYDAGELAINDDFYEDLTVQDVNDILTDLKEGRRPQPGPRSGRLAAEPMGKLTSLTEEPKGPGFGLQAALK
ncbi:Respiratory-chain NADH dehydrogenase subunit [Ostertagia ostertagi]